MTVPTEQLHATEISRDPQVNVQKDPGVQLGYLQQCLSSNKMPLGLFLGAGCPMGVRVGDSPLIPDIAGLTAAVKTELLSDETYKPTLEKLLGQFAVDGNDTPTVELMLSQIRMLRAVAGREEVRGHLATDLENLDTQICKIIQGVVDKALPNPQTPYHRLASWVESIERERPIEIFTTNYDLLMEQAFEDLRVPYFDGFAGSRKPFFDLQAMESDPLPPRWARLWKLHGSVNWYQVDEKGVYRGTTTEAGYRRVIHPSHMKYEESRRMPYLAMIDRLRAFLKTPTNTLIICGYSFRDEHINEVIVQGLQSTPTATSFSLLYGPISNYPEAIKLAKGRTNLTLLASDGAVISGVESTWPSKAADTLPATTTTSWIEWTPIEPAQEGGDKMAKFLLGDFAIFGRFLHELIGAARQSPESSDGK